MDNEDSIDLETLQAQIDLSLSFAHEMISSWVKPSRKLPSRSRDIEGELKEYMRRPPRLGVGAAIPQNAKSSRDMARLKGQLAGKGNKRPRDDGSELQKTGISDDEGESRGGVIKKKPKVDPFGGDGKKKKKKATPKNAILASPRPSTAPEAEKEEEEVVNMVIEGIADPSTPSTPSASPQQKRPKIKRVRVKQHSGPMEVIPTPSSPASSQAPVAIPLSHAESVPQSTISKPKLADAFSTTSPKTPAQLRRQAESAALLQHPLLNLTPPDETKSEDDDGKSDGEPGESPKKKKRRRKKKKKRDVNAEATSTAP